MRHHFRYVLFLILFNVLLAVTGFITQIIVRIKSVFYGYLILSLLLFCYFSSNSYHFFQGQNRESDSQTMHTLVAISLKFLLD